MMIVAVVVVVVAGAVVAVNPYRPNDASYDCCDRTKHRSVPGVESERVFHRGWEGWCTGGRK